MGRCPTLDPSAIDRVMHVPMRLGIMGLLCQGYQADFSFLKEALGATDGNLASHLRVLEEAGYLKATKRFVGRKPNTMYAATADGKSAYATYRRAMLDLLSVDPPTAAKPTEHPEKQQPKKS